jgi:hypothetical protein
MSIRTIVDDIENIGQAVSMPIKPKGPAGSPIRFATLTKLGDLEQVDIQGEYIPPVTDEDTGETKEGAWFFGEKFAVSDSGNLHMAPGATVNYQEGGITKSIVLKAALEKVADLNTNPISTALPIGSIIQSFLDKDSFQGLYGANWALCNGQEFEGPELKELTGWKILPDLSGKFLRSAGGSAGEIGVEQAGKTAVNGLFNTKSTVTSGSVTSKVRFSGKYTGYEDYAHSNDSVAAFVDKPMYWVNLYGRRESALSAAGSGVSPQQIGYQDLEHTHYLSSQNSTVDTKISGQEAAAQPLDGDEETRPVNVAVNTYIRIN